MTALGVIFIIVVCAFIASVGLLLAVLPRPEADDAEIRPLLGVSRPDDPTVSKF